MPAHRLQKRIKLYGFEISIENAKGSSRHWYDPHGKQKGSTKMYFDYGYIRGTKGTDGDHVDVYVGPNPESSTVFIVNQMKKVPGSIKGDGVSWTRFDEQKVMLAFKDAEAAKAAYLRQYDDPRFFGSMKEMSVDEFKQKVLDKANHGKKVASGDMIAYFQEHPEKLKEYLERKKKTASLIAAVNLAKLSSGETILGDKTPAVTALPAVTAYSEATMSKDERKEGDRQVKEAAEGRVGRIADRVDDVGIGLLAAPYVADVAGHGIAKAKNPKLKALGTAIEKGFGTGSGFGKSHAREIGGLALVAPGVTHAVAKGVDRAVPEKRSAYKDPDNRAIAAELESRGFGGQEADDIADAVEKRKKNLEKVAHQLFDDFEYKTESEKIAIMNLLGRMAGSAVRAGSQAVQKGKGLVSGPGVVDRLTAGFQSARLGRQVSPQAVQRGRAMASSKATRDAAFGGQRIVDPRGRTMAEAPKVMTGATVPTLPKPAPTSPAVTQATGGTPTPVTSTTPSKWNPLRARNVLLGGAAAATGLAAYGGYKGIQTGAHLLQSHHEMPLASPVVTGPGRQF